MGVHLGFLQTKVARRILFLFLICALLPVTALSLISYFSVRNQLLSESRDRLSDMTKNTGVALAERLQFLETTARLVLVPLMDGEERTGSRAFGGLQDEGQMEGFEAAVSVLPDGSTIPLLGEMTSPASPSGEEAEHLRSGSALVRIERTADGLPEIIMGLDVAGVENPGTRIWARLRLDFLWQTASGYSTLPSTAGFCVLEQSLAPLFCNVPDEVRFIRAIGTARPLPGEAHIGLSHRPLEWEDGSGGVYLAVAREIFLRPQFFLPGLTVSVSESRESALASAATFRSGFWGVMIAGLMAVALLSNLQIRKTLGPLEELRNGTRRLSKGDFTNRVIVESRDEFEDLAESFNDMASDLEVQFQALETIGEMDRSILSALDADRVIETALLGTGDLLVCDRVAVCRLDWVGGREGRLRVSRVEARSLGPKIRAVLSGEDLDLLRSLDQPMVLEGSELASPFLGAGPGDPKLETAVMASLEVQDDVGGFLAVGRVESRPFTDADKGHVQRIAEQLSLALSNAWLLEELERMGWGALTALARTVDAKSPWTSGHSEQVAAIMVEIGRGLGLPDDTLNVLQRGGLVHDIGKIGVPGKILDKPGNLTPEERLIMEKHPVEGVRILEPVPGMGPILPMVLHHHEAWDGSGYPNGLSRESIPLEARIMAVADQFDALSSDRPYRPGFSVEKTIEHLKEESGVSLDPNVVEVLLGLLDAGEIPMGIPLRRETVS